MDKRGEGDDEGEGVYPRILLQAIGPVEHVAARKVVRVIAAKKKREKFICAEPNQGVTSFVHKVDEVNPHQYHIINSPCLDSILTM